MPLILLQNRIIQMVLIGLACFTFGAAKGYSVASNSIRAKQAKAFQTGLVLAQQRAELEASIRDTDIEVKTNEIENLQERLAQLASAKVGSNICIGSNDPWLRK